MVGERRVEILIVGGGASGTLLAIQLLRHAAGPLRVAWIDEAGSFARGLAYGAAEPFHVLNVPALRMSAFPDRPRHLLEWCSRAGIPAAPGDFLPRRTYGSYLEETLEEAERGAAPSVSLVRRRARMRRILRAGEEWEARFDLGAAIRARHVVLACGNFPSAVPSCVDPAALESVLSPWDGAALDRLPRDADLLLLGCGLTMVDAVLSLRARGHRGRLLALSRHGLLPRLHAADALGSHAAFTPPAQATLRELVRAVRARIAEAPDGWHGVLDALRPHVPVLWQSLAPGDRRRFLRHVRAFWEVHRHRLPPGPAAAIGRLLERGTLEVRAGRLVRVASAPGGIEVRWHPRGDPRERTDRFAALINCTGPAVAVRHVPLLQALIEDGVARRDPLGLGLATIGGVVARAERGEGRILAIGPLRRGELFETTAIPEIRVQAEELALGLLRLLRAERADAPEAHPLL